MDKQIVETLARLESKIEAMQEQLDEVTAKIDDLLLQVETDRRVDFYGDVE